MKKQKQLKNKKKGCKNMFLMSSTKKGSVATDTNVVARRKKFTSQLGWTNKTLSTKYCQVT